MMSQLCRCCIDSNLQIPFVVINVVSVERHIFLALHGFETNSSLEADTWISDLQNITSEQLN